MSLSPEEPAKRLEDAITYLVSHTEHQMTRTKLVKLLYFVDLRASEVSGAPTIGIPWRWHHFGPFAREIYDCVQTLEVRDELRVNVTRNYYGNPEYHLSLGPRAGYFGVLSGEDIRLAQGVLAEFGPVQSARLAELSYYTVPMETVHQRGDLLDFTAYATKGRPDPYVPDFNAPPPAKMAS